MLCGRCWEEVDQGEQSESDSQPWTCCAKAFMHIVHVPGSRGAVVLWGTRRLSSAMEEFRPGKGFQ